MFNLLKKIIFKENSVRGASLILVVTLALSNILGVLRDHFLAQKITTDQLDSYFAAFRLPDLVFNILILGSVAAAFVPIYSQVRSKEGEKKALELAQSTITIGFAAVMVALATMFILMPYLMELLVPDFEASKKTETIFLARILLFSPAIFTFSYFIGSILNCHKRFVAYSVAPLIYNLSIIVSTLVLADKFSVRGVVVGVIIGALLHLAIQLPSARKIGFVFKFRFDFNDYVKRIIKLMVPRAIGLGANQFLLVAFTSIASAFPGAIAIYSFSDNIQTVPSVIFGTSFATAVFPTLASLSLKKEDDLIRFNQLFVKTIRAAMFFLVPSAIVLFALRAQIIRLILGYGFFGWTDTKAATATLGFFALSIIAQGLIPILARSFYAMQDTKTPMYTGIFSIIISIVCGYIFSKTVGSTYGVPGLALGYSIGSWVNFLILAFAIEKRVNIKWKDFSGFIFTILLLTGVVLLVMQFVKTQVGLMYDINRVLYLALQTILSLIAGGIVYFVGAYLAGFKELK